MAPLISGPCLTLMPHLWTLLAHWLKIAGLHSQQDQDVYQVYYQLPNQSSILCSVWHITNFKIWVYTMLFSLNLQVSFFIFSYILLSQQNLLHSQVSEISSTSQAQPQECMVLFPYSPCHSYKFFLLNSGLFCFLFFCQHSMFPMDKTNKDFHQPRIWIPFQTWFHGISISFQMGSLQVIPRRFVFSTIL